MRYRCATPAQMEEKDQKLRTQIKRKIVKRRVAVNTLVVAALHATTCFLEMRKHASAVTAWWPRSSILRPHLTIGSELLGSVQQPRAQRPFHL